MEWLYYRQASFSSSFSCHCEKNLIHCYHWQTVSFYQKINLWDGKDTWKGRNHSWNILLKFSQINGWPAAVCVQECAGRTEARQPVFAAVVWTSRQRGQLFINGKSLVSAESAAAVPSFSLDARCAAVFVKITPSAENLPAKFCPHDNWQTFSFGFRKKALTTSI